MRCPFPPAYSGRMSLPPVRHRRYESPVGPYFLLSDDAGKLLAVYQATADEPAPPEFGPQDDSVAPAAVAQLDEYFAGTRTEFELELEPHGSEFQLAVWRAIAAIPFGETRSYGEIAAAVGSSARAVGGACGRNPHAVVVPCHRVLAADRTLHGYGGGLAVKRWLLTHEGVEFQEG